jgi:hypothetical protein
MILDKAMIINYDCYHRFIVLATINMIVNYERKLFIVQAAGKACQGKTLNSFGLFTRLEEESFIYLTNVVNVIKLISLSLTKRSKSSKFLFLVSFPSLVYYL